MSPDKLHIYQAESVFHDINSFNDTLKSCSLFSVRVNKKDVTEFRRRDDHWQRDTSNVLIPISPEEAWDKLRPDLLDLYKMLRPIEVENTLLKVNYYLEKLKRRKLMQQDMPTRNFCDSTDIGRSFRGNGRLSSKHDPTWQSMCCDESSRCNPSSDIEMLPTIKEEPDVLSRRFNGNESTLTQSSFRSIYMLHNWTVLRRKDGNRCELFLHGTLYDMQKTLLEDDFTSSKIITRLESRVVRTTLCDFALGGKFIDHGTGIPKEVRAHFQENEFPENWKLLSKLWDSYGGAEDDSFNSR